MAEPTLYDRLGGAFAIAAVIDHFSDALVRNPIAGQESENPELREWSTNELGRLPGLKIHAHPVGLRHFRWTPALCCHETGQYSSGPGRGPSRTEDLSRPVRRGRG